MSSWNDRRARPDQRATAPYRIRLGDNDRAIIRLVHEYRLLSQGQIQRLLGRSRSTVQRLLRRLYDHRYLERVFLPVQTFGSSSPYYILDRQGAELLQRMDVCDLTATPSKAVSSMYIEHTTAINDFRIGMQLAVECEGWRIEQWLTEGEIKADYDRVKVPDKRRPVALVPDGYFSIGVPGKGTTHFFLELDRGKMQLDRFRQKIEAYVAYYRSGGYTRRFGAQGFRLLTVVESAGQRRVQQLMETTAQVPGIGRRFWFTHLEQAATENVLHDPIWRIAGIAEPQALFTR